MNCSRRTLRRSAQHAYHTGTYASSIAHAGITCTKKPRSIEISLNFRWTFFHFQSMSSRGRPHGHRYGKKPGDKEYYLANQLKKKRKKKKFQGIHDHDFRARMIENNRGEEVCRRWDVLADEDHTYYRSEKEYFYNKNKWWLHLNKSGSDTLPLRNRSDFKQALSTLERLHQEDGGEQFAPTPYWKNKQRKSASSSSSTWWEWQDSRWSS